VDAAYLTGQNRCWAIRSEFGGMGWQNRPRSRICDCGSKHMQLCSQSKKNKKIHCCYFYSLWQTHGEASGSWYTVKAQMTSTKAICLRFQAHHTPLTSDILHSALAKSSCTNCTFTFWVKDEKNNGVVHHTKRHAGAVARFMRGQDKYIVSDILPAGFEVQGRRPSMSRCTRHRCRTPVFVQ
jgi:hypothetical protein